MRYATMISLGILTAICLSRGLSIDKPISDYFFNTPCVLEDARACWAISKDDKYLTFWLHDLPKRIGVAFGVVVFLGLLLSFRWESCRRHRVSLAMILVSVIIAPALISWLKSVTGHYCPGQLALYGGPVGRVGVIHLPKPKCFPAEHPAFGFALFASVFCPLSKRLRLVGGLASLLLGTTFSLIQLARGEHFLSHVLATAAICLSLAAAIGLISDLLHSNRPTAELKNT